MSALLADAVRCSAVYFDENAAAPCCWARAGLREAPGDIYEVLCGASPCRRELALATALLLRSLTAARLSLLAWLGKSAAARHVARYRRVSSGAVPSYYRVATWEKEMS